MKTKILVIASRSLSDPVQPIIECLLGAPVALFHTIDAAASYVRAHPSGANVRGFRLWFLHQHSYIALAADLADALAGIEVQVLMRPAPFDTGDYADGLQKDLDLFTRVANQNNHSVKIWSLAPEIAQRFDGISLLGHDSVAMGARKQARKGQARANTRRPAPDAVFEPLKFDASANRATDLEALDASGSLLTFRRQQVLDNSVWNPTPKDDQASRFAASTMSLVTAKRAGHALPQLEGATADQRDIARAIWRNPATIAQSADQDGDGDGDGGEFWGLFIVPNGLGLGHVSRSMAIAMALCQQCGIERANVGFWCYSQAAQLVQQAGFAVVPRQTARHLGIDSQLWSTREQLELSAFLAMTRPRVLLVDHSGIDPHLQAVLEHCSTSFMRFWIRRGFWRRRFQAPSARLTSLFDAVLVPGDLAGANDTGPLGGYAALPFGEETFDAITPLLHASPVVLGRDAKLRDARKIQRQLAVQKGLNCLVSLGGSGLTEYPELMEVLNAGSAKQGVVLHWLLPPLGPKRADLLSSDAGGAKVLPPLYPLVPYMPLFDGMILGGGYNSVHEAIIGGKSPVLFVPSEDARKDDQLARVSHFADQPGVFVLRPTRPDTWASVLKDFFGAVRKQKPRKSDPKLKGDGAQEIAAYIDRRLSQQFEEDQPG